MTLRMTALTSIVLFMLEDSEMDVTEVLNEKGYGGIVIERWREELPHNRMIVPLDAAVILYGLFVENYWNADDYETAIYENREYLVLCNPGTGVLANPVGPGVQEVRYSPVIGEGGERMMATWKNREDGKIDVTRPDKMMFPHEFLRRHESGLDRI